MHEPSPAVAMGRKGGEEALETVDMAREPGHAT